MKLIGLALLLLSGIMTTEVYAQTKVKEKDLIGNWKLVFQVEEGFEEARQELENENSLVGKVALSAIEGLVTGLLDELEIYMEFQKDGQLRIIVNAFGEEDVERGQWFINKNGQLFISDTENYEDDDESFWMFEDDVLVNFDKKHEPNKVYLVRL